MCALCTGVCGPSDDRQVGSADSSYSWMQLCQRRSGQQPSVRSHYFLLCLRLSCLCVQAAGVPGGIPSVPLGCWQCLWDLAEFCSENDDPSCLPERRWAEAPGRCRIHCSVLRIILYLVLPQLLTKHWRSLFTVENTGGRRLATRQGLMRTPGLPRACACACTVAWPYDETVTEQEEPSFLVCLCAELYAVFALEMGGMDLEKYPVASLDMRLSYFCSRYSST